MKPVGLAVLMLTAAAPAAAQTPRAATAPAAPAPAAARPAAAAPIDPARLALARTTVEAVWPLGTYQRMMSDMMMDQMMGAMFDMKLGDMVPQAEMSEADRKVAGTTMREAIASKDPHFEERMRITNKVIMAEMAPIMGKIEPAVRDGLAKAYAKKFTVQQLTDLNLFFATPTGRFYATESLMLFMDPELMKAMLGMMPELVKGMPAIMKKVESATAHLPQPKGEEEEEESGEEVDEDPRA